MARGTAAALLTLAVLLGVALPGSPAYASDVLWEASLTVGNYLTADEPHSERERGFRREYCVPESWGSYLGEDWVKSS